MLAIAKAKWWCFGGRKKLESVDCACPDSLVQCMLAAPPRGWLITALTPCLTLIRARLAFFPDEGNEQAFAETTELLSLSFRIPPPTPATTELTDHAACCVS